MVLKLSLKGRSRVFAMAIAIGVVTLSLRSVIDVNLPSVILHSRKESQDLTIRRALSINLGNGECQWTKPVDANQDTELFSTLLAAYPGSGKRTAFMQLEGVTELRAGDDYNLTPFSLGKKFAFLKSNYPQHEGIWSFGDKMDQSILLIRNPRWALPSYQAVLHEIDYSEDWQTSYDRAEYVYTMRPPIADWITWREIRFDAEIKKWGWFVDYWMEGGLCRDVFTNELTTHEHFLRLIQPHFYAQAELVAEQFLISQSAIQPTYDPHCIHDIADCRPTAIASFEKMIDPLQGPAEVDRFIAAIEGKAGLNVIEEEARACVWRELIVNGKGNKNTFRNRDGNGPAEAEFMFTLEQMEKIQDEILRLRDKYSSGDWASNTIAQSLVTYLNEYLTENQDEIAFMNNPNGIATT